VFLKNSILPSHLSFSCVRVVFLLKVVVEKEIVYETVYKEKEGSGAPPEGYLSPAEIAAKIQAKEEEIMSKVTKEMAARQVCNTCERRRNHEQSYQRNGGTSGM